MARGVICTKLVKGKYANKGRLNNFVQRINDVKSNYPAQQN